MRLSKVAKEFNVGISTIVDFLEKKGIKQERNPNAKIDDDTYRILEAEFSKDKITKKQSEEQSKSIHQGKKLKSVEITDTLTEKATVEKDNDTTEAPIKVKDPNAEKIETIDPVIKVVPPEIKKPKVLKKIKLSKTGKKDNNQQKEKEETKKKSQEPEKKPDITTDKKSLSVKVVGKIDLTEKKKSTEKKKEDTNQQQQTIDKEAKKEEKEIIKEESLSKSDSSEKEPDNIIHATVKKIEGPKVIGTISLEETKKSGKKSKKEEKGKNTHSPSQKPKHPVATSKEQVAEKRSKKRRRKRIIKKDIKLTKKKDLKQEITSEDIDKKLQETLSKMNAKSKSKGIKYRRDKRNAAKEKHLSQEEKEQQEKSILKVTEFISVSEIATMMDVPVQDIIMTCMSIGLNVSINQRLDADTISLLAEEFGFEVKFVSADIEDDTEKEEDNEKDLLPRPPIVTIMGHVDHGKTKLLDYIRKTNVIDSEAGGITQHIGAYSVNVNGKNITFLDTPGHEAFTAMRARGAQVTDIVIIVIAADDGLMPQTIEAINHAQAAGVPMIFAINKIDKPSADPERIKGQLAQKNILLEDWGGKIQSQEISAKQGTNIDLLLEKILLEAELLNLKANPNTQASGVVIESSLEKGRGYVATILVQRGTLKMKDIVVAGTYYGHAKAMFNENNQKITEAGPSTPLILLGLNGAPQAGDKFKVVQSASAAKEITTKRKLLLREQSLRTKKHITLDEIGRRLKVGNFKELNFVVKGDVDGSIEAMSDAIIKLSNDEIQINVIHKAVGQISESDVMLAAASNAVILGFQVRPSLSARQLAQKEEVEIRMYSVIYDAVNEIKDAMEGMLSPEIKEKITGSAEVKEIFKISRVGKVAGCQVIEGKIHRNAKVRIIRDGIVIFTGEIESLKRYKEEVEEVKSGMECGISIKNFKDIKVSDVIEGFTEIEIKRKL